MVLVHLRRYYKYMHITSLSCFLTYFYPNGHILVDSPSIRRRYSTWKIRQNFIDFERRIHVEIMTSIRRGNFEVDSTFKID